MFNEQDNLELVTYILITYTSTCLSDNEHNIGGIVSDNEKGRNCHKKCHFSLFFFLNFLIFHLLLLVDESNTNLWLSSDRDYTYDELFNRVFEIILEKNPDMAAGRKPKFVMRPPQVLRVGTKKTSFANFTEICKTLHR